MIRRAADRAALTLGLVSIGSVVFTLAKENPWWGFVTLPGRAVPIAVALGVLASVTALLARPVPQLVVGAGFLAAAFTVLLELALGVSWTEGDGSTLSAWAGLGIGMIGAGLAPRDDGPPPAS